MTTVRQKAMEQWVRAINGDEPKKPKKDEEPTGSAVDVELLDGPRRGDKLRLVNPPPKQLRLILPGDPKGWCTYKLVSNTQYEYIGDVNIDTGLFLGSYSSDR